MEEDKSFYANLADQLDEKVLDKISSHLRDGIDEDLKSREEWMQSLDKVHEYLGLSVESTDRPFKHATGTYDSTMTTVVLKFVAFAVAEILLDQGIMNYDSQDIKSTQIEDASKRVVDYLNYMLTVKDTSYYADMERFFTNYAFCGSIARKVYYDDFLKMPVSRYISARDFIVNNQCKSILESDRITHRLRLSRRAILERQKTGFYSDVDLPYLRNLGNEDVGDDEGDVKGFDDPQKMGIDVAVYSDKSLWAQDETEAYLDLGSFESADLQIRNKAVPLPYIITTDLSTKKIVRLVRNWKKEDVTAKRREHYVLYNLFKGFGLYGFGFAHLIGGNAIAMTKIMRIQIDQGLYQTMPAGFRVGRSKTQDNDITVAPGEWKAIDDIVPGGGDMKNSFLPLPHGEPSMVLQQMLDTLRQNSKELGSISDLGMLQSREDIPTATLVAALEHHNTLHSAVLKSLHKSLGDELRLYYNLWKEFVYTEGFEFDPEYRREVYVEDFTDDVRIMPISDPSVNSNTQRLMRTEAVFNMATRDLEAHNKYELYKMYYEALGVGEDIIEKILKPQMNEEVKPLDPASENANLIQGKPVTAAIWQYHDGHILEHGQLAEQFPDLKPAIFAHIRHHEALKYLIEIQQRLGFELPAPEQLEQPEVQNSIAVMMANNTQDVISEQEQQEPPISPEVLNAQIEQEKLQVKREEMALKERLADKKIESDTFNRQLDFEATKAKLESEEDIARLRSDTELTKQGLQQ